MVVHKRKKNRKYRGSRTHGWGVVHRGSGTRGGVGMSGGGKKCHSKKDMYGPGHLGKSGFKMKGAVNKYRSISIKELEDRCEHLLKQKLIEKKGDFYDINLTKLGYGKLLSQGTVNKKFNIKTSYFSGKAKTKIEEKGGKIVSENVPVETSSV